MQYAAQSKILAWALLATAAAGQDRRVTPVAVARKQRWSSATPPTPARR
jgi:hypothetical protein